MPEEIINFFWNRDKAGYQWDSPPENSPDSAKQDLLVRLLGFTGEGPYLNPKSFVSEYYLPFENPSLFRTFAETKTDEKGILQFAERFGQLGPDNHISTWQAQIKEMSFAVALRDMVQARDVANLAAMIRWEKDAIYLETDLRDILIASADSGTMERFKRHDPFGPAMFHLQRIINKQLEGQASATLLWTEDRSKLQLIIMPASLIGALWLQLARTIDQDTHFRACAAGCGKWIALRLSARADALYCSPRCRTAAWRSRPPKGQKPTKQKRPKKAGVDLGVELSPKPIKKHEKPRKA